MLNYSVAELRVIIYVDLLFLVWMDLSCPLWGAATTESVKSWKNGQNIVFLPWKNGQNASVLY